MSNRVSADDFAAALWGDLSNFNDKVTEGVKKAVDIVADETNEEIKNYVSFEQHTGDYVKNFRLKTTQENALGKTKTWYVQSPDYRLTHLLEKGHAKRGGGRTKAFPHIEYGEKIAQIRMEQLAKEAVENAGH